MTPNFKVVTLITTATRSWTVRCQSKDTDLGLRTLHANQQIHWDFHINLFKSTLFFCHFYWGAKDAVFNVFTRRFSAKYCAIHSGQDFNCTWEAREDGFDVSNGSGNFTKIFDWNKKAG
ncbi:hypothetical protein NMG60_11017592 [Bertholletia excelsa]